MNKLVLLICVALSACASTGFKDKEVVVQKEYIVRTAPTTLKTLPLLPDAIDVTKADQITLANWLNKNEDYIAKLEAMIGTLVNFYEKPVDPVTPAK